MRHRNKWITLGIVRPNAPFRDVVGAHNQPVDLLVHAVIGRRGVGHQTDAITVCNAEPIDILRFMNSTIRVPNTTRKRSRSE